LWQKYSDQKPGITGLLQVTGLSGSDIAVNAFSPIPANADGLFRVEGGVTWE